MGNTNSLLTAAKTGKNDEFYTRYSAIDVEVNSYDISFFKDKWVYCPCDDYRWSNFYRYFKENFHRLNLRHLTSTNYDNGDGAFRCDYDGHEEIIKSLTGNGDFRNQESTDIKNDCDMIATNPPFSLFRDFISWIDLANVNKQILILGNMNAITYKNVFPLIKDNKMWLGITNFNNGMYFRVNEDYEYADTYKFEREMDGEKVMRVSGICWYTNMMHGRRSNRLALDKVYAGNEKSYPRYDNYDAIEVSNTYDIPSDYNGIMGVPITFIDKYCCEQFEILGNADDRDYYPIVFGFCDGRIKLNGKEPYKRIFIARKGYAHKPEIKHKNFIQKPLF